MSKVQELKDLMVAELHALRELAAKAENREETGGGFTADEREEIARRQKAIEGCQTEIKALEGDAELRKTIEGLGGFEVDRPETVKTVLKKGETWGQRFAAHVGDSVKAIPGFATSNIDVRGVIAPFEVSGGMKALITGVSDTSAGAFVTAEDLGLRSTGTFQRPLTLRDVITNGTTNSDSVEYVRVTGFTNAASPTAEATAASGTTGTKPESALTFERVTANVRTIAHWVPITRRALSDAGQIRTIVDNFLRYGLEEEVEDQIIAGTGTSEDFEGLAALADDDQVQDQAWSTDLLTTTRKARTLVRTVGRDVPNAYLFNPADWERLDLTQDAEDRYYFGGPMVMGTPRLWGLPVVESEAVPSGVGYVGNFRQCVLWDREQASITVGTINDQLIRNMLTILAEMRAAFGCFRPASIVRIDLTA